jgi:hypothetical protein
MFLEITLPSNMVWIFLLELITILAGYMVIIDALLREYSRRYEEVISTNNGLSLDSSRQGARATT